MQVFESAKGLWSAILQQFRWESHTPKRTLDEIEILCSVFLAILFAHYFGAENIGWAAFSGYMVLRSHSSADIVHTLSIPVFVEC